MRSFAQSLFNISVSILLHRLGFLFLIGWICGLFLFSCLQRFQLLLSDSSELSAAAGLSVILGIWLGLPAFASLSRHNSDSISRSDIIRRKIQITLALISLWSLCFPLLLNQLNQIMHLVTIQQLSNFVFLTGLLILAAMALIMPAAFWCSRLFWLSASLVAHNSKSHSLLNQQFARFLAGLGVSLITAAIWLVPQFGWTISLMLPAGLSLLVCSAPWIFSFIKEYLPEYPHWVKDAFAKSKSKPDSDSIAGSHAEILPANPILMRGSSYLVSLSVGVLFVTISRILFQLYPDSLYLKVTIWAAFLSGIAAAFALIHARSKANVLQTATCLTLGTGIIGVGCLALFPLLISAMLYANAYIEYAQVLAFTRGSILAFVFCLLGCCWGGWLNLSIQSKDASDDQTTVYQLPLQLPFCFLAGAVLSSWLIGFAQVEIKMIAVFTSLGLLCLATLIWGSQWKIPQTRRQRGISIFSFCILLIGIFFHQNYDSRRSAKLLFSTNTFTGLRHGLNSELLPHLDEGRCFSEIEGEYGTFTLWSYRENQIQIRRSGLPYGVTTVDAGLCPHTTSEIMPFLLPVVLHERPSEVLFLGLGSGAGVNTSLDYPVQNVTCLESDSGLVKLYQEQIAPRNSISAFETEQVKLIEVPAALAMAARSESEKQYDLIISNPVQSVVTQSQSEYTAEFYQNVSRHLNTDGIFCQRFQHIDFGAQPLRVMAHTLLSQFKRVMAIEIANGETLFLATNSDQGFIRENLIDRVKAPQVRRTLAQVGWDWSVLLNLAAYSDAALKDMTHDVKTGVNNTSTGTFAFTLPFELMRWGLKRAEVQNMVSKDIKQIEGHALARKVNRTGRLINWMRVEQEDPIVLRRLSEVTAQNKLMAQYPDQYWKYRKPAKDQITENPRSLIKQVAAEALDEDYIHDEDKSRMLYFKALSDAMEKANPSIELISRVVRLTSTYDPMISYFMHDEVAELYKKSQDAPPILEFSHRLHAINYGAVSDRSINSVVRAIELAATNPEMFQKQEQQWDHLNGLLQTLKLRWGNRSQARPLTSKQALHDIELSMSAIDLALKQMDDIHDQVGISDQNWKLRKKVLERTLTQPLQTYHNRVLPHHYKKSREESKNLLESLNLPETSEL